MTMKKKTYYICTWNLNCGYSRLHFGYQIIILALFLTQYQDHADDTQLYISFKCKDPLESLTKLNMCIYDIRVWMIKNKLKFNDSETEFIIFRSPLLKQNMSDLSISVGDMQVSPSYKVRDLGVVFD